MPRVLRILEGADAADADDADATGVVLASSATSSGSLYATIPGVGQMPGNGELIA